MITRSGQRSMSDTLDGAITRLAQVFCWANAVLIAVIICQVVLRYGFGKGLVALEELEWHLYAFAVMTGLSYALVTDSHVRVDIMHMRLSQRARAWIEIGGIVFLLLPFMVVVFDHSIDFLTDSWRHNERSDAPSGLPWRWAIKALMPISFALLALAVWSRLLRQFALLRRT